MLTTTSSTYSSKLNRKVSRRQVLQLGLGLSATIATFKFRGLSNNATTVLICLNEFQGTTGAKLEDLASVANYASGLKAKQVKNAVDELIRLNFLNQRVQDGRKILFVNQTGQFMVQ